MRKRWRLTIGCGAAGGHGSSVTTAPAGAVTTEQVEFTVKYSSGTATSSAAGSACGRGSRSPTRRLRRRSSSRAPLLRFPKGAVVNGRRFPKCKIDALRARGPRACPRGSKLGSGHRARCGAPDRRQRERQGDAVQRRRRGPQPVRDHLLDPGPGPDHHDRGRDQVGPGNSVRLRARRQRCRRSRRCRAPLTPRSPSST